MLFRVLFMNGVAINMVDLGRGGDAGLQGLSSINYSLKKSRMFAQNLATFANLFLKKIE